MEMTMGIGLLGTILAGGAAGAGQGMAKVAEGMQKSDEQARWLQVRMEGEAMMNKNIDATRARFIEV
jgi:hypothetical protein